VHQRRIKNAEKVAIVYCNPVEAKASRSSPSVLISLVLQCKTVFAPAMTLIADLNTQRAEQSASSHLWLAVIFCSTLARANADFHFTTFIYFFDIKNYITGVKCMTYAPQKRVKMIDVIRSNILERTHIKDKELAKQIAREWIRKAGGKN